MRALFATLLMGGAALAQDAPKDVPTFKVTTQLVTVNVSAADKHGNAATGLKASDFVLTEDGKKQKIAVFEYQKLDDTVLPALPKTRPDRKAPRPKAEAAPPAAPLEAAKPGEVKYRDRRLLVLYFDMTSMPIPDQINAQESALQFLQTQMTASDVVAVMSFSSRLNLLQDFTADRAALLRTVNGLVVGDGSDMAEAGSTPDDDSQSNTGAAYTADETEFNIFSTDRKLVALQAAVKMLGGLPEKKALLYYSSGIRKSGVDNEAQMRATTNAAIRANVALYPIDARGLVAFGPGGDSAKGSGGGNRAMSGALAAGLTSKLKASQETLHTLAVDTGGRELVDNNDLSQGIVQAQKGIGSYYIVGYYSSNQALDGQYRRIKLQHNDKTVKLEYRAGYFAGKQFKQFTASDRERQLQEALLLGDPMTELSLALEINYFRIAEERYFVPLQVKMPGSEIELARHGGADTARLDFIGQVKDGTGKVLRSVRDNLEIRLKGVSAAELSKKSLSYDTGFSLGPGRYSVKFLARENSTGKMGTFESSFTVPNLKAEEKALPISSVVLSNQVQVQGDAVASGQQDKKALGEHPLIRDGKKLIPSVTRVFHKDQTLYVYLETYQAVAEPVQPVEAMVGFYRGRQKVFETPMAVMQSGFKAKSKALPVWFALPLKGLEAGQYTCQVSVLNPAAQKAAFWRAPIAVLAER
jgi:VWFA-related protein